LDKMDKMGFRVFLDKIDKNGLRVFLGRSSLDKMDKIKQEWTRWAFG
jgi:hypothetical protein